MGRSGRRVRDRQGARLHDVEYPYFFQAASTGHCDSPASSLQLPRRLRRAVLLQAVDMRSSDEATGPKLSEC
jgi:hypothetical protein